MGALNQKFDDNIKSFMQEKLEKLRVIIQKQPIRMFCIGLLAGLLIAIFFRLVIAIFFLTACVAVTAYLVFSERKNNS